MGVTLARAGLLGGPGVGGRCAGYADKIKNPTAVFSGLDKITGRIVSFEVAIDETVQFGALQMTPARLLHPAADGEPEHDLLRRGRRGRPSTARAIGSSPAGCSPRAPACTASSTRSTISGWSIAKAARKSSPSPRKPVEEPPPVQTRPSRRRSRAAAGQHHQSAATADRSAASADRNRAPASSDARQPLPSGCFPIINNDRTNDR